MILSKHKNPIENIEAEEINNILLNFEFLLIELFKDMPSPESLEHYVRSIVISNEIILNDAMHKLIKMLTNDNIINLDGINTELLSFFKKYRKQSMILLQIILSTTDFTHEYDPNYPTNRTTKSIPMEELFLELKIIYELHQPLLKILKEKIRNKNSFIRTKELFRILKLSQEEFEAEKKDIINPENQETESLLTERLFKIREFVFEGVRNSFLFLPELFSHDYEGYALRNVFNRTIFQDHSFRTETTMAFLKIHLTSLDDLADKILSFLNSKNSIRIFATHYESDLRFVDNLSNMILEILDIFGRSDILISRGDITKKFSDSNPNNIDQLVINFNLLHQNNALPVSDQKNTVISFELSPGQTTQSLLEQSKIKFLGCGRYSVKKELDDPDINLAQKTLTLNN